MKHFSKYALNTYQWTPYFDAFVPPGYPISLVLQKARAFRRLPPNVRDLAAGAKQWAVARGYDTADIDRWYDAQGYELDPDTGRRLTDAEVDALWDPDPSLDGLVVADVPVPLGGLPDPTIWEPPPAPPTLPDPITVDQLLSDVAARGIEQTEALYGIHLGASVPADQPGLSFPEAQARFAARTARVLASPYFRGRAEEMGLLQHALRAADTYPDLCGQPEQVFDRAEEYEAARQQLET